jgi:hypothetical protein
VPASLAERILRFHLVDNTRGEPDHWTREQIRRQQLSFKVAQASDAIVRLQLDGSALMATSADPQQARRGFDAQLTGNLTYDRKQGAFTQFDVAVLGDHWGEGTYTRRARPGRTPLGVVFELGDRTRPRDRIPPQGARNKSEYLGRG